MQTKILILAANPADTDRLKLDSEIREIKNVLQLSPRREYFEIKDVLASDLATLQNELLNFMPDIVHFSGHAKEDGLYFHNEQDNRQLLDRNAVARLFSGELAGNVKCVVLNACQTHEQATDLSQYIDNVIGMTKAIGDDAAIKFASGFYRGLFSEMAFKTGKLNFEVAHASGRTAIDLNGLNEWKTPQMKRRPIPLLGGFEADVLIHALPEDLNWAHDFMSEFRKHLTQAFGNNDRAIRLCTNTPDPSLAPVHLFVISEQYANVYQDQLETIVQPGRKQFLIIRNGDAPAPLAGLTPYRFDDSGSTSKNSPILQELAKIIKRYLNKQIQIDNVIKEANPENKPLVFIHTEPDEAQIQYATLLKDGFKARGFACSIPHLEDYGEDVKLTQNNCQAVLIVYGNNYVWTKSRIFEYQNMLNGSRNSMLKMVGIHADCTNNQEKKINLDNLKDAAPTVLTFPVPPKNLEEMLELFVRGLA